MIAIIEGYCTHLSNEPSEELPKNSDVNRRGKEYGSIIQRIMEIID